MISATISMSNYYAAISIKSSRILVYVISFYRMRAYTKAGYAVLCNLSGKPNAKVMDFEWKSKVKALLKETGAFEALLVNRENCITEGSLGVFCARKENLWLRKMFC